MSEFVQKPEKSLIILPIDIIAKKLWGNEDKLKILR